MGSEFSLIRVFSRCFNPPPAPEGPGDDCAVLESRGPFCVTTDSLVQGVHFTLPQFRLEDVGYKALAVNLSDLAAMGAQPSWFLCALSLPKSWGASEVRALGRGMGPLARRHGIALVGGNITSSPILSLTLTLGGTLGKSPPLLRSGGRPGDRLYVSGTLGDARLGLRELNLRPTLAVKRQKRPLPKVALGLAARPLASAAIDLSDGFAQDLGHLCDASNVGARVSLESLPLSAQVRRSFRSLKDAALFAAAGGEDYELLLAVPRRRAPRFERMCRKMGERVTHVGELVARRRVELLWPDGRTLSPPRGFDHFD